MIWSKRSVCVKTSIIAFRAAARGIKGATAGLNNKKSILNLTKSGKH